MANDPYNNPRGGFRRDDEYENGEDQGFPSQRPIDPRGREDEQGPMGGGGGGGSPIGGIIALLLKNPRVAMALVMGAVAVFSYFTSTKSESNPITDKSVRVPWGPKDDVPLGLQAAPGMIQQHGGEHRDQRLQAYVDQVGMKLVQANAVGDWAVWFNNFNWDFHLLADEETINAFALPGGQIFFTYGLFKRLTSEDQVAGVLGHEIGHVVGRHSAQQMAKSKLVQGVAAGGAVLTSGGQGGGAGSQILGHVLQSSYGREHESESDRTGAIFMVQAGYNPEGLIDVMKVLKEAMGGQRQPEFMSSHPDPGNRIENIKKVIEEIKAGRIEGPREVQRLQEASETYSEEEDLGGQWRK